MKYCPSLLSCSSKQTLKQKFLPTRRFTKRLYIAISPKKRKKSYAHILQPRRLLFKSHSMSERDLSDHSVSVVVVVVVVVVNFFRLHL